MTAQVTPPTGLLLATALVLVHCKTTGGRICSSSSTEHTSARVHELDINEHTNSLAFKEILEVEVHDDVV